MRLAFLLSSAIAMAAPGLRWNNVPLSFEPSRGEPADQVRYVARAGAWNVYLAPAEMVLAAVNQRPFRTKLAGANVAARIAGEGLQPSTSNYFIGDDSSRWRTRVPNYSKVRYSNVYPGIDLLYYGNNGKLEYDWIISSGGDPGSIRMVFDAADRVRVDKRGDLFVKLGKFEYQHGKPIVYQEVAGSRAPVEGSWIVEGKEARFRVGAYDRSKQLIIDPPLLVYSTYQGGLGTDYAYAIATDSSGNTYVTGGTGSTNFPTGNAYQPALNGQNDAFVIKLNAAGTARVYSTFLGGGGVDEGTGIAVDSAGNAYVTGTAGSTDFPRKNAIQNTYGGSGDAFITKLDPTGSALVYSTYLGGGLQDNAVGIAVDPAGNAYVAGSTFSTNLPTVNAFQASKGSLQDAFVAKVNATGSAFIYVTYLGGNDVDQAYAIACDVSGNAYVAGYTASSNFPLQSPIRASNATSVDAFVTKINPAGSALVFSTYFGGSATDYATAIAVDSSGGVYVGGIAISNDLPVVNAFQPKLSGTGVSDAFVAKFNPNGTSLAYSTYLGGTGADEVHALAVDQNGNAWVTGRTNSGGSGTFPVVNPIQASIKAAFDIFVSEVSADGKQLVFSTYLGGTGSEYGWAIAVDSAGIVHVAGETTSTDFPIKGAIQGTNGGGLKDGFVAMIGGNPVPAASPLTVTMTHNANFIQGEGNKYHVVVSNPAGNPPTSGVVNLALTLPAPLSSFEALSDGSWNCPGVQVTCTRSDALPPGASYPPIDFVVLMPWEKPVSTVTSQITVTGGGLPSATTSDLTVIQQVRPSFFDGETYLGPVNLGDVSPIAANIAVPNTYNLQFPNGNLFGRYSYKSYVLGGGVSIVHEDMGELFVYVFSTPGFALIIDERAGHLLLTGDDFPYMFDLTLGSWIYYFPDKARPGHYTSNPPLFFRLSFPFNLFSM